MESESNSSKVELQHEDDPLVDIPPEFPATHSRFPTVPSVAFEESIRDAAKYKYEPGKPSPWILELLGISLDEK